MMEKTKTKKQTNEQTKIKNLTMSEQLQKSKDIYLYNKLVISFDNKYGGNQEYYHIL